MKRRDLLKSAALGGAALWLSPVFAKPGDDAARRLARLERVHGGRLGVAVLDTGSDERVSRRGDERFLLCSTFKLLLVAAVLARVDRDQEQLERRVVFGHSAVLDWAPVTSRHVGAPGLTISRLCEAAIELSDNTAANLLLASVGGPAAVTAHVRGLGDRLTRLDRIEPALNRPDGDKDTTTPAAMLGDMRGILLGNSLSEASRERLTRWLIACRTGADALRAGLPPGWRVGDKTGSGDTANNDVAIAWPPRRKPVLVTAYYDHPRADAAARSSVLAEVGRIVGTCG